MPFFSYQSVPESSPWYLEPFSPPHIVALATLILLGALIVVFRKALAAWKGESRMRLAATIVAVFFQVSLHVLQYLTQGWYEFVRGVIPLELCFISLALAVALNVSKSRGVWDLLYFWGLGAGASLVFANTEGASYNTFHFYQYFITHGYTLLTIVWFGAVAGYRIRFVTLLKAVGVLIPIAVAIRLFDQAFSGEPWKFNFMFLVSPPDISTPLDGFGHGWGYFFAFAGLCIAIFLLAWLPWGIAALMRPRSSPPRPRRG